MEEYPLKSSEVDAEVLIQMKDNVLQVYGLSEMTMSEVYVILASALQGLDLIMEKNSKISSIH